MVPRRVARIIHLFFDISVIAKGIDGALEIVGGVLLLLISPTQLHDIVRILTQHELTEDPHDLVANYLLRTSQGLSLGAKTFSALYLFVHGVVKAGLVTALLQRRKWAYPVAIITFLLILVYELYRYSHTHTPALLVLSALDTGVIMFTWWEYMRLLGSHAFAR